jgi:hypothetical protein
MFLDEVIATLPIVGDDIDVARAPGGKATLVADEAVPWWVDAGNCPPRQADGVRVL